MAFQDDFKVTITFPVHWGDMDAFGHVNNTLYFRYFEHARIQYFDKISMMEYMEEHGIGPILASTSCRFRLPLTYPDEVTVGGKVVDIDEDRFTMEYAVFSHRHQKVAATGEGILVTFHYEQQTKAPIPPLLLERIEEIEGKSFSRK